MVAAQAEQEYALKDCLDVDTPLYPRRTALTAFDALQRALEAKTAGDVEVVDHVYGLLLRAKDDITQVCAMTKKSRELLVAFRSFPQLQLQFGRNFAAAAPESRPKHGGDDDADEEETGADEIIAGHREGEFAGAGARD